MSRTEVVKRVLITSILTVAITGALMAEEKRIVKGSTVGHYQKPGAPVDLTYSSTRVDINEISDVNISLTTTIKSGEMEVGLEFDNDLEQVGTDYSSITFPLSDSEERYNINLRIKSAKDGLYYIRLMVKIKDESGIKMRALAVPIYVGNGQLKKRGNQIIMKASGGENLSISKAKETVKILK